MSLEKFIDDEGSEPIERVNVPFSRETIEQIKSWIRTNDVEELVRLLEDEPAAIAHPEVRWYVVLLRRLGRKEFIGIDSVPIDFFPLPKSPEALSILKRLAEASIRGLFPAGWSVKIKSPRGAPKQISKGLEWMLLVMFNNICNRIDEHADARLIFGTRTTELDQLVERVAILVQDIGPRIITGRSGKVNRLPIEEAGEIARSALQGKKMAKRRLALSILARMIKHSVGQRTPKALESLIGRAEGKYPDLDVRRRSKRKP